MRPIITLFWRSLSRANWSFATIAVASLFLMLAIPFSGFGLDTSSTNPYFYPIAFVFILSPFGFLRYAVKFVRSCSFSSRSVVRPEQLDAVSPFQSSRHLDSHIEAMERPLLGAMGNHATKSRLFERLGQIAMLFGIGIPFTSWLTVLMHLSDTKKLEHLSSFVFSSTSFGLVTVTIAVTLFRHSKRYLQESNALKERLDQFRRLRVAISSDMPDVQPGVSELLEKYWRLRLDDTAEEEKPPLQTEESKNSFSMANSVLSKT